MKLGVFESFRLQRQRLKKVEKEEKSFSKRKKQKSRHEKFHKIFTHMMNQKRTCVNCLTRKSHHIYDDWTKISKNEGSWTAKTIHIPLLIQPVTTKGIKGAANR